MKRLPMFVYVCVLSQTRPCTSCYLRRAVSVFRNGCVSSQTSCQCVNSKLGSDCLTSITFTVRCNTGKKYNQTTQNYWVSGLCPSSGIQNPLESTIKPILLH
jgi:hypothetical protein